MNRPGSVQNTFGEVLLPTVDAINQEYKRYMEQIESVKDYLRQCDLKFQPEEAKKKRFMVLTMTPYCKQSWNELVPAEFSVAVFSVDQGIIKGLVGFIEPKIPFGERGEVTLNCERSALPFPGNFEELGVHSIPRSEVLSRIEDVADRYGCLMDEEILIFAMKAEIAVITNCIRWLEKNCPTGKWRKYRIVSFEMLLMALSQLAENAEENVAVIRHEGGAGRFLYQNRYEYNLQLGCAWHRRGENVSKIPSCAFNITLRRVYNALFYLCRLYGTDLKPKTHRPATEETEVVNQRMKRVVITEKPNSGKRQEKFTVKTRGVSTITKYRAANPVAGGLFSKKR
ncbi:Protein maelstrom 1 [Orchesella cincta]|uniref:Protein maelstrom 1 n=1 Tax=Orchesella cincta TaxID=48709 RepID=A0A1D2N0Y9_ORCCI|nr:Protein maelstrom 1 [Orchesella cincta]